MCFLIGKDETALEKIIESNVDYLNKHKSFSFTLYRLKHGENLKFNMDNNEFIKNKNKINMVDLFKKVSHMIINNKNIQKKGLLKFKISEHFHFSNHNSVLEKVGNKIIGKRKNMGFLKKTFDLKDFIGPFILMKNSVCLDDLDFNVIEDGDLNIVIFYRKELSGIINSFTGFFLYKGEVHHALIVIDGDYVLYRIENNLPEYKDKFTKFVPVK